MWTTLQLTGVARCAPASRTVLTAFFVSKNDEFAFNYVMRMPNQMHNQVAEFEFIVFE